MWPKMSTRTLLLVFLVSGACDRAPTTPASVAGAALPSLTLTRAEGSKPIGWPQVLLPVDDRLLLWGHGREFHAFEISEAGLTQSEWELLPDVGTLDEVVSAGWGSNGTIVLLDWAGRVLAADRKTGQSWRFETLLRNSVSGVAVAHPLVYLLLHGGEVGDPAVMGYRLTGEPVGSWGSMPIDGLFQGNLRGGGIAACPDGSVFFSYVNSPGIERLTGRETRVVAGEAPGFHRLSRFDIRQAQREAGRSDSVAAIVRLGLTGSRVMALHCTAEGLLLRQVARPSGGGAYVEVWNPVSESLVGLVESVEGLLIGAVEGTLLFSTGSQQEGFRLARTRLQSFDEAR